MWIKRVTIDNFRLFSPNTNFEIDEFNTPDDTNLGSGLNLFVGENGCGKTALLDALTLPLLPYKAEKFDLNDFYDPHQDTNIEIFSEEEFEFDGTMPRQTPYKGKGFAFKARVRSRDTRKYLSSLVVQDQKFIKADGEEKPKDHSPDLRINVNNPFKGNRFDENDILFLDKNRTYQTRSGTYNPTRFDRLMEDFDFQYFKSDGHPDDYDQKLEEIDQNVENKFLNNAKETFKQISGYDLWLSLLDNHRPHKNAFFNIKKDNNQHIPLNSIGSGYEMIFTLIYSFYLAQQSGKQLIILIDEPELHLHPKLQKELVNLLLEFSKTAQIFLTTHSPLFVKQLLYNDQVQVHTLKKENNQVTKAALEDRLLPYMSANEINFIAFGVPTEEYHNELYNKIESEFKNNNNIKDLKKKEGYSSDTALQVVFDNEYFSQRHGEQKDSPFKQLPNTVTKHTYIRNKIHHSQDNEGYPNDEELEESIKFMRSCIKPDK